MSKTRINNPRLILAKLRKGDFAHAGDIEAIDMLLSEFTKLINNPNFTTSNYPDSTIKKALDIGSGLGGTAEYIRNKTSYDIYGVDIDPIATQHAKSHYPNVTFQQCDVMEIDTIFPKYEFDFIYMFNVFYAVQNQEGCLNKIANIAKPGAILAVFDYTKPTGIIDNELKDLAGKSMYPLSPDKLKLEFDNTGWELLAHINLSAKFKEWYDDFLILLNKQKNELLEDFEEECFDTVNNIFTNLSFQIKNQKLGGGMFFARRKSKAESSEINLQR